MLSSPAEAKETFEEPSTEYHRKLKELTKNIKVGESELRNLFNQIIEHCGPGSASLEESERRSHGGNLAVDVEPGVPDLIFYPTNYHQVQWIINLAADNSVPLVPFGRGTSLSGQATATCKEAAISLDMHRMNEIISFDREGQFIRIQAGMDLDNLNLFLEKEGFQFPIDPMINATIGGLIGTNAEGLSSIKYGRMKDQLESLKVALANAEIINVDRRTCLGLMGLFCGSQGSLGIVIEAKLKIVPKHDYQTTFITFSRLEDAAVYIPKLLDKAFNRCFLVDACGVELLNRENHIMKEAPTIMLQHERDLGEPFWEEIKAHCAEFGVINYECSDQAVHANVWNRLGLLWTSSTQIPMGTTFSLPPNGIAEFIREVKKLNQTGALTSFPLCFFGNVGIGSVTTMTSVDPTDGNRCAEFIKFKRLMVEVCSRLGGDTCDGFYNVKEGVMDIMWKIKDALDPNHIFNPKTLSFK